MLDINFIKENKDKVIKAISDKQLSGTVDIEKLLNTHNDYINLLKKVELHRALRNRLSENISKVDASERTKLVDEAKQVKEELQDMEKELAAYKATIDDLMLWVPNVPAEDVPFGANESGNVEIKKIGILPEFTFKPKEHHELAKILDIIDTDRGAKVGGFRGYFLKNEGAELEMALLKYAVDMMKAEGFTFMTVPWLVDPAYFTGTGYFPWGKDDHYMVQDNEALIGTAEVSLTSYHAGEVLDEKDLPVRLVGMSPCFRREIGTYGKDTKGIFRVHQFTKVEMVVLCKNDESESREWHEKMLAFSERLLNDLGLSYHVLLMCTGDMGPGHRKKYDIETWFPGQGKYRETHSDSYFLDFQSRRLNIKYKTKDGDIKYVHTLNNTVAASPRLLAAIMENYQNEDGSINVPKVLVPYVGYSKVMPK